MFLLEGTLSRLVLLASCVVLGVAASNADSKLSHGGQLKVDDRHTQPALRGGPPVSTIFQLHRQHPIVALQASQATHRQDAGAAVLYRDVRNSLRRARHTAKNSHQGSNNKLALMETEFKQETGVCRGMKLKWWIKIKKKCAKAYGPDSKWDRSKLDGQCTTAWDKCNTGFYAVCCTQPLGPRDLGTYCAQQNMKEQDGSRHDEPDKACDVQRRIDPLQNVIEGIKETVKLMDETEEEEVQTFSFAPSPAPGPAVHHAPSFAPASANAPPGLVMAAPAPVPVVGPKEHVPSNLESKCDKLKRLTREAKKQIDAIKAWAQRDGIDHGLQAHVEVARKETDAQEFEDHMGEEAQQANPESVEAKDPDLVFSLQGVLKMGDKLQSVLDSGAFCSKPVQVDDDDDDDDDVEEDLKNDPATKWKSDDEDDEDEDEEPKTAVIIVNQTAVMNLIDWESDLKQTIVSFETQVHPHGFKWWRYRYEYTVIESLVLSFSVLTLYCVLWILHGLSFFRVHKFYRTGLPQRLSRYGWVYFLFHAAGLMVMVTLSYMLYIPWGKDNIFNLFANFVHDHRPHAGTNVPFLGYSWLYMFLDVQFQLFACYCLYAVFIVFVTRNFTGALRSWKILNDGDSIPSQGGSKNIALYRHLDQTVKRRLKNEIEYRRLFQDCKLRVEGVDGLDNPGWLDFKLHLLLTEALGKTTEFLVEVSLNTHLFLCLSTLIVALLAHHFQVAFMYFLPGFVVLGLIIFAFGYGVSWYFRNLADDDNYKVFHAQTHSHYVTLHSFCRAVQILLYCLFFSFARLLLSNDIFEYYAMIYIASLVGLVIILILLWAFAGEVIKETACALMLPPHIPVDEMRKHLENIVYWHTYDQCHECGSLQMPAGSTYCKEWTGMKPVGARPQLPDMDTPRPYSWRG